MSLSNSIRISFLLPNVEIFTFGESTLFGYDSLNHCLIVIPLIELNHLNDQSIISLHLSSIPPSSIRELILNPDQTILALISDQTAFLVYLPQLTNSPSTGCRLCPVNVIPPFKSNCTSAYDKLTDFLWLSPSHFVIVNSIPSSSECHLYLIRPSKHDRIEFIQTFSVGCSTNKKTNNETLNKKISLHQSSDIIKLDLVKRKVENSTFILLIAIKSDGDIFLMEIDQNQLTTNVDIFSCSFVGPIRILPSTFDNYGADYRHSRLLCLSCGENSMVLFTRGRCEITQCILLNPLLNEYYLFAIDSIHFSTNPIIKSLIIDQLNSNRYYILDSSSNVYSIEISWINQIQQKSTKLQKTSLQHLIQSDSFIYQIGLIQTMNKGQWLAIITKTTNDQQKELIFLRPHSLSNSTEISSRSSIETRKSNPLNSSSEFFNRIRTILHRDQSLPRLTLPSSAKNISNTDFETNLLEFLRIFSKEYFEKQEKARIELENKQRYLSDFEQTQRIAKQELQEKFQQIDQTFQTLNEQYQREYSRRKDLSTNVDDLLSVIEQHTPVVSDAEVLMQRQLTKYDIQINSLKEKISRLKQFLSTEQNFNPKRQRQQIDPSAMDVFQEFAHYFRNQIDIMKQQIQTVHENN